MNHPKGYKLLCIIARSGSPVAGTIDSETGRVTFNQGIARTRVMVEDGKLARLHRPALSFLSFIHPPYKGESAP